MASEQPGETADPYAFDAPCHYIDFNSDSPEPAHYSFNLMPSPQTAVGQITPMRTKPIFDLLKTPTVEETSNTGPPSIIVTSWDDSKPSAAGGQDPKETTTQPSRVSKRPVVTNEPAQAPSPPGKMMTMLKSSERLEMERTEALQEEVAEPHERNEARCRAALACSPSPEKIEKLKITRPQTPQQRSWPVMVESPAEIEAEEVEEMQQFEFKALELNRNILEGAVAPKQSPPKEATQPVGFHLEVEKRLQERHANKNSEHKDYTFRPLPLPVRILEGVVSFRDRRRSNSDTSARSASLQKGVPKKKLLNLTVPETPAFALRKSIRIRRTKEAKLPAPIKALPVPRYMPFVPRPAVRNRVEVCAFSFEQRDQERKAQKEKRLEELRREETPKFKARPNAVTQKDPFVPKKENRAVFVPEGFQLATERRAKERLEFERTLKEKETMRMQMEERLAREQEEQEEEEIARLRHEQVHKAQPIRHYRTLVLKPSETPLTVPHSPQFSNRFRM